MEKKILWFLLGGLGLFLVVAFLYQQLINAFASFAKKEPIGFFDVDFTIVGIITILLVLIGVTSVLKKGT
ncbi:hypothetical protein [Ekhidna sp.]|uniref:hypothetical protein n=1 Tax=Ekhidna sp. TaxID=2608089 RepID=UPI0032EF2140